MQALVKELEGMRVDSHASHGQSTSLLSKTHGEMGLRTNGRWQDWGRTIPLSE